MKHILILVTAFVIGIAVHAQNLSLGPTLGFGHGWNSSDVNSPAKKLFHPAYNAGLKMVYSFESGWGLSLDAKFSGEGTSVGEDKDNKIDMRANYIRVPLQGIRFFGEYGNALRPKISLGPSFGFLVGGKIKTYSDGEVVSEVKSKDFMESFDFGLTGAVGLNYRLSPNVWLNTDIAYYHGLLETFKNGSNDIQNRNIGLNVGVTFPLGTVKPD